MAAVRAHLREVALYGGDVQQDDPLENFAQVTNRTGRPISPKFNNWAVVWQTTWYIHKMETLNQLASLLAFV